MKGYHETSETDSDNSRGLLCGGGVALVDTAAGAGSIYGLLLMLALLMTGVVKIHEVKAVGDWLITLMPIMFVAPTAGLILRVRQLPRVHYTDNSDRARDDAADYGCHRQDRGGTHARRGEKEKGETSQ